jgi:hypothetical protein
VLQRGSWQDLATAISHHITRTHSQIILSIEREMVDRMVVVATGNQQLSRI